MKFLADDSDQDQVGTEAQSDVPEGRSPVNAATEKRVEHDGKKQ
jgi:hypothetical protein